MDSHVPLGRWRSSRGRRREKAVKACYVATGPVVGVVAKCSPFLRMPLGCARWKALEGTPLPWSQIAVTSIWRAARTFAVRSPDRPSKATRSLHKSHPTSLRKSGTSNSIRKCNKNLPGTQRAGDRLLYMDPRSGKTIARPMRFNGKQRCYRSKFQK